MSKVQGHNKISTGYGNQTAGGAQAGKDQSKVNESQRNQASKTNPFKDPFKQISPATQTGFDFDKVTQHGSDLSKKARERYANQVDETGQLVRPDDNSAANRNNPIEKQRFSPETGLTAFQGVSPDNKDDSKETKKSKQGEETLIASHQFDQKKTANASAGAADENSSSSKAVQA